MVEAITAGVDTLSMEHGEYWRALPFEAGNVPRQLAAGDALLAGLAHTGQPALRWYRSTTTAMIAGRGQPLDQIDTAACRAAGVGVYRRSSGGTAVLMEPGLIMLDVALPVGHRLFLADVTESYRWFGGVWVAALQRLGITAHPISIAEARTDGQQLLHDAPLIRRVCFGGFSPYEVMVGARKLVGLSQVRRRNGALLQAGVYLRWQPHRIASLLALAPAERATLTATLDARATGLYDVQGEPDTTGRPPLPNEGAGHQTLVPLIAAFAASLEEQQGVRCSVDDWSDEEARTRLQATASYTPL